MIQQTIKQLEHERTLRHFFGVVASADTRTIIRRTIISGYTALEWLSNETWIEICIAHRVAASVEMAHPALRM